MFRIFAYGKYEYAEYGVMVYKKVLIRLIKLLNIIWFLCYFFLMPLHIPNWELIIHLIKITLEFVVVGDLKVHKNVKEGAYNSSI